MLSSCILVVLINFFYASPDLLFTDHLDLVISPIDIHDLKKLNDETTGLLNNLNGYANTDPAISQEQFQNFKWKFTTFLEVHKYTFFIKTYHIYCEDKISANNQYIELLSNICVRNITSSELADVAINNSKMSIDEFKKEIKDIVARLYIDIDTLDINELKIFHYDLYSKYKEWNIADFETDFRSFINQCDNFELLRLVYKLCQLQYEKIFIYCKRISEKKENS